MSFTKEQVEEMQRRITANALKHAFPDPGTTGRGLLDRVAEVDSELTQEQIIHSLKIGTPILMSAPLGYSMSVIIDIDPIGAPRQSRRDAWKPSPRVLRYRAWKDSFVPACMTAGWTLGPELRVEFEIAMPPSWSKKKKAEMLGKHHQQKPDVDNCCKSVMDAFGVDDGYVHTLNATKRWAEKGRIILYY